MKSRRLTFSTSTSGISSCFPESSSQSIVCFFFLLIIFFFSTEEHKNIIF